MALQRMRQEKVMGVCFQSRYVLAQQGSGCFEVLITSLVSANLKDSSITHGDSFI